MRFTSLRLHKYGHFEDCYLDFPAGELDFHLISGSNEAGKSTTLSAVQDLLFGFPHHKSQDYRFDAALLRVGGQLQNAKTTLDLRRRRGTQNTLTDEAGAPLQEAAVQAMLQGRSAEEFRQKFSLDHQRLREGGRSMVDARGDVGQTLFAGGAGVLAAQNLLRSLQSEAEAIWAGARTRTSCRKAQADLADAEARLKKSSVKPREWKAARELCESRRGVCRDLEDQRDALQDRVRTLNRTRALAVPVQQRAALLAELHGLGPPAFDPGQEATYTEAARALAAADLDARAAEAAIGETEAARAGLTLDVPVLDRADEIEALLETLGASIEAERDLPGAERELQERVADSDRLIHALELMPGTAESVLAVLPAPAMLAGLQQSLFQRQKLLALIDAGREQLRTDRMVLDQAKTALIAQPAPVASRAAATALREGQTTLAIHDRLPERRRVSRAAERAWLAASLRLAPWTGDAAALALLQAPAEDDVRAADGRMQRQAGAVEDEQRTVRRLEEEIDRLSLELRELSTARRAVSAADIAATRDARARVWTLVRGHIVGHALTDPMAVLDAYEQAVAAADARADERFDTATASARLAELGVQLELVGLDRQQAEARLGEARAAQAAGLAAWSEALAQAGLPLATPAALLEWRTSRLQALQMAAALAEADAAETADREQVASVRARLVAALADRQATDDAVPFMAVLDQVQAVVEENARSAARRAGLEAQVLTAEQAVDAGERRLHELTKKQEGWEEAWESAWPDRRSAMKPDSLETLLPLFEKLRGELESAIGLQHRTARMRQYRARFEADAWRLAAACAVVDPKLDANDMAAQLRAKLTRARGDARAAADLNAALTRKREALGEARHRIAAAHDVLAPLMATAGVADHAGLAEAMRAASVSRDLLQRLTVLDQAILANGDGTMTLETLVAGASLTDPGALAGELSQLQPRLDELNAQIGRAAQAVGEASQAFDALEAGGEAALSAAADAEQARATLRDEAQSYLLKRTQVVMLTRAIDTYRREQESPLLKRASELFGALTVGRYTALDIDRDGREPKLVGVCADGRTQVPVEAMSDGTADQLFLALRLASLEQSLEAGVILPFLADDLFINFDDDRAQAGFKVLGAIARRTQVLFFTHHNHLRSIAAAALHPHAVPACSLS